MNAPEDALIAKAAEVISWAAGDFTRYDPDAHPDHNRWSWRGDGHSQAFRDMYLEGARAVIAAVRGQIAAEALREAADSCGVNIGDEDDDWWSGYRQAQREFIHWLRARAEALGVTESAGEGENGHGGHRDETRAGNRDSGGDDE